MDDYLRVYKHTKPRTALYKKAQLHASAFRDGVLRWLTIKKLSIYTVADAAGMSPSAFAYFLQDRELLPEGVEQKITKALGAKTIEQVCAGRPPRTQPQEFTPPASSPSFKTKTSVFSPDELRAMLDNSQESYKSSGFVDGIKALMRKGNLDAGKLYRELEVLASTRVSRHALGSYLRDGTMLSKSDVVTLLDILVEHNATAAVYNTDTFKSELLKLMADKSISRTELANITNIKSSQLSLYFGGDYALSKNSGEKILNFYSTHSQLKNQPIDHAKLVGSCRKWEGLNAVQQQELYSLRSRYVDAYVSNVLGETHNAKSELVAFYEAHSSATAENEHISAGRAAKNDCEHLSREINNAISPHSPSPARRGRR